MHFIGMLALKLEIPVNYDVTTTVISILPAIFASAVALEAMNKHASFSQKRMWLNAALMGGGIGMMHHMGMAAMQMDAVMTHDTGLLTLSILLAILLSFVSLKVQANTAGS